MIRRRASQMREVRCRVQGECVQWLADRLRDRLEELTDRCFQVGHDGAAF
jgi:hypothetical protein